MTKSIAGLVVCATIAALPAWSDSNIADLANLLTGTFDSHAFDPGLSPEQRFVDKRLRLDTPNIGDYVFYQQINERSNLQLYRQRILVLTVSTGSNRIQQRAFKLRDAEWYVDAESRVW